MTKVPNDEKNANRCICSSCPTYTSSPCAKEKKENVYCATGKTSCELVKKNCLCGVCPLWEEYNLSKGYFCFSGQAE